jgi:hypothetical protein
MPKQFLATELASASNLALAVGAGFVPGLLGNTTGCIGINLPIGSPPVLLQPDMAVALKYPSASGEAISLVSASASDVGSIVNVEGIDANDQYTEVFIALNGITPVPIGNWKRINYMRMVSAANVGRVSCTIASGTVCYITITGSQVSDIGRFSVPVHKKVQVLDIIASMTKDGGGANAAVILSLWVTLPVQVPFLAFAFAIERRDSVSFNNRMPLAIEGPLDLELRGYADVTNTEVYTRLAMIIQDA